MNEGEKIIGPVHVMLALEEVLV